MGAKWESVIFERDGISAVDVAISLSELTPAFVPSPKVMVHFMYPSARCESAGVLSCELTSFRTKPVFLRSEAASQIDNDVFGETGMHFKTAEALAAKRISEVFSRAAIYLHYNDVYGSLGYVLFKDGETKYYIENWEGTNAVRSNGGDARRPFVEQVEDAFAPLKLRAIDDLFDCFYSDDSKIDTFLLAERGDAAQPVRQLYD